MKIDTERVISEVHLRPLLWNKQNELYKNREARPAGWLEICKEIIPNFENYTKDEQKDFDKKIQQRWRTARDMYKKEKIARNLSSGSGAKKKKKYEYFEILTFLDRVIDDVTDESLRNADDVVTPSSPTTAPPSPSTSAPLTPLPSTSASTNPQSIPASAPPTQKRKKATSEFENTLLQYLKSNQLELESEDLAFFQSLQPTLKRFTNYQKMLFRAKVMQVIMEIEKQNINYSMSGSMSGRMSVTTPLSTPNPYDMGSGIPANTSVFESDMTIPAYNTTSYVSGPIDNAAILESNTTTSTDTPVIPANTSVFESDMTIPAYNTTSYVSGPIDNAAILESNTTTSTDTPVIPANTSVFESDMAIPAYNTTSYVSGPFDNAAILKSNTTTYTDTPVIECYTPSFAHNTTESETHE